MSRADEIDAEAAVIRNIAAQHEQDAAIARAELAREQLAAWRASQQPSVRMGPARVVVPFSPTALDYFAAHALQGMLASDAHPDVDLVNLMGTPERRASRARFAFDLAAAMLAEKAKRDGEAKSEPQKVDRAELAERLFLKSCELNHVSVAENGPFANLPTYSQRYWLGLADCALLESFASSIDSTLSGDVNGKGAVKS